MSKRSYGASMVLDRLLNGERLTAAQITFLTNGEQQSRVMDELRKAFIPWECDQSANDTVWFIPPSEIERYHNCRDEQIADERSHYYAKKTLRLDRILREAIQWRGANWLIKRINEQAANDPVYDPEKQKEPKL
ncbi:MULTISPECIES: hypothetical protein [Shewanella]|uniref:Uncharacterized protein n=1 Tax=Shewanella marisflavi TaxID=260364 RepID=A0ABX5WQ95_9GAMM|nr:MULTISPECIES: hypothetical protein [Shewanella]QDF75935.1 hypothetical protein FGA12_12705 [Shewanella marisflavi]